MRTAAGAMGTKPTTRWSLYDCAKLTCSRHSWRKNPRYTLGRKLLNFDMKACLKMSTPTSDPSTIRESTSILRVSPPASDPAAVTRCAATKRRQMLRCTRSTISMRATAKSLSASMRLNTCPLISPKLFDMSNRSIALVCELMATESVTACVSMIMVCATVAIIVSAASKDSWKHACASSATLPSAAAVLTTMYTEFCKASRTWQLKAQHSLSKHSNTLIAR
mmetsp:Transcript_820/g.1894  ORF Transcript_820/g.1894 Transcript_820/m.1894 type:complete len:222 (-) Transcript_820:221-886(-)